MYHYAAIIAIIIIIIIIIIMITGNTTFTETRKASDLIYIISCARVAY